MGLWDVRAVAVPTPTVYAWADIKGTVYPKYHHYPLTPVLMKNQSQFLPWQHFPGSSQQNSFSWKTNRKWLHYLQHPGLKDDLKLWFLHCISSWSFDRMGHMEPVRVCPQLFWQWLRFGVHCSFNSKIGYSRWNSRTASCYLFSQFIPQFSNSAKHGLN